MDKQFIETVKKMRQAQKEYFRTKNRAVLTVSKQLESKVDKMIEDFEQPKLL